MIVKKEEELTIEEISEFKKRLSLDNFELQLLMHHMRIPLKTLKKRYPKARSDLGRLLIKTAIEYKEQKYREEKKKNEK